MMPTMSTPGGWGPSHQTTARYVRRPWWIVVPGCVLIGFAFWDVQSTTAQALIVIPGLILLLVIERIVTRGPLAAKAWSTQSTARTADPLAIVRAGALEDGGGVYLGVRRTAIGSTRGPSGRCCCSALRAPGRQAA
jgi:hypothetical protein